jgi:hypothetical protein
MKEILAVIAGVFIVFAWAIAWLVWIPCQLVALLFKRFWR